MNLNSLRSFNGTATKKLRPVHPGDILRHDFMQPLKLSAQRLAKELGLTAPTVNDIARRRRAVTAEMALRLSRYFGTTAQLWQNLQSQYDLESATWPLEGSPSWH
jgi:addiction module HigA family antidote